MEDYITNWWDERTFQNKPLLLYKKDVTKLVDTLLTEARKKWLEEAITIVMDANTLPPSTRQQTLEHIVSRLKAELKRLRK